MSAAIALPGAASEDEDVQQRVRPEPVRAVDADTQATLARGVEAGDHAAAVVGQDAAVDVGRDAAHRVVGGRLDRHEIGQGVEPEVGADEAAHVGELLVEHLRAEMAHVEVDVVLAPDPPPLRNLEVDRSRDDVARGEVLHRRGVALHEPLSCVVDEEAALAAHRLRQEEAELVHAGRMELEELHVLERQAAAVRDRHPVAGEGVGIARDLEHLP